MLLLSLYMYFTIVRLYFTIRSIWYSNSEMVFTRSGTDRVKRQNLNGIGDSKVRHTHLSDFNVRERVEYK